jgi:hypothetical protein
MVSKSDNRFIFSQNSDACISKAFLAAFAPDMEAGSVDVSRILVANYEFNDAREVLYAQGRRDLSNDLNLAAHQVAGLPEFVLNDEADSEIMKRLAGKLVGSPVEWPITRSSDPSRVIDCKTDRPKLSAERRARLMCLAILRSVDSYFLKIRSNMRPAPRPTSTPRANGQTWDRHFLRKPPLLLKITET